MNIFATSSSPVVTGVGVGSGASKYTALVDQYVQALAPGSKASLDGQISAYENLQSLLLSGDDNGNLLYQTNKTDLKRAVDAVENSDFGKRLQQLNRQFETTGFAATYGRDPDEFNLAKYKLDLLNRYSADEQKIIFASERLNVHGALVEGGHDVYYETLDAWKADLKQKAAAFVPASANPSSSTATTEASAAPNRPSAAKISGKAITAHLPKGAVGISTATVALHVLLNGQEHAQTSRHGAVGPIAQGASGPSPHSSALASSIGLAPSRALDTTA